MKAFKASMMAMALAMLTAACSGTNPAAPSGLPAISAAATYELSGEVLGAGGAGLAGVEITLSKGDEERHGVSDENGKFRFAGLEAGDWTATLKCKGYEDRTVDVVIGGNLTISFDMLPAL